MCVLLCRTLSWPNHSIADHTLLFPLPTSPLFPNSHVRCNIEQFFLYPLPRRRSETCAQADKQPEVHDVNRGQSEARLANAQKLMLMLVGGLSTLNSTTDLWSTHTIVSQQCSISYSTRFLSVLRKG